MRGKIDALRRIKYCILVYVFNLFQTLTVIDNLNVLDLSERYLMECNLLNLSHISLIKKKQFSFSVHFSRKKSNKELKPLICIQDIELIYTYLV